MIEASCISKTSLFNYITFFEPKEIQSENMPKGLKKIFFWVKKEKKSQNVSLIDSAATVAQ